VLALSILQPYAWLICAGHKDIENRTWPTRFRGRFLVHAGKNYNRTRYLEDRDACESQYGIALPTFDEMSRGGIVGVATLTDCVREHASRWKHPESFGYVLADCAALPFVPLRGQLKFFDVPEAEIGLKALACAA